MKKIVFYIISAIVMAVAASSCEKSGDDNTPESLDVAGQWHLVSSGDLPMESVDVYVSFDNGSFFLYQKIGEGRYRRYAGTYIVSGSLLSGSYSDGTSWGSDYDIALDPEGELLTMTARNGSGEVSTYERKAVPEEVLDNTLTVKSSAGPSPVPFL